MVFDRKLILEDGSEYLGQGFGAKCTRVAEIVFNTSMAGYQEIVSDPSYTDRALSENLKHLSSLHFWYQISDNHL